MSVHVLTTDSKLAAIERLIPLYRAIGRAQGDDGTYEALKAIALDLRAVRHLKPGRAGRELLEALARVRETRDDRNDYDVAALISLAEALASRWPLVRQALEVFEKETTE